MDLHVRLDPGRPLSPQIYRQLLNAILDGRLRSGQRLPPTREFARRLHVSRNTVGVAYELLAADGLVRGRVGAGSFVDAQRLQPRAGRRAPSGVARPRPGWRVDVGDAAEPSHSAKYDFSVGVPDPRLFPTTIWSRLVARASRDVRPRDARYGDTCGLPALREAIARHVGISRAVRAEATDVLVTQGAQQAFDLIGRVLIEPGTCVAVEDPGYPVVHRLFESLGADVVGVPVNRDGLDVGALPRAARVVYVTPSHQFPLGMPMSLEQRTSLLEWADRRGAVIIEDDYDSEFRFGGRPLDPLQSLDRTGRVIYVGSFSKVLLPSLRLGFLIAPASLLPALGAAKQLADWQGVTALQATLAQFIDEGLLSRHIRKLGREYAARHTRLAHAIEARCGQWLRLIPSEAGLHVTAEAVPARSLKVSQLAKRASRSGLRLATLADFSVSAPPRAGLVFGYGLMPADRIDEAIGRLASLLARSS